VSLGVRLSRCVCICVFAEPRLHARRIGLAAKVMRCIQCSLLIAAAAAAAAADDDDDDDDVTLKTGVFS